MSHNLYVSDAFVFRASKAAAPSNHALESSVKASILWHFVGDEATAIFRYHVCGETALTTARSAVGVAIIST